MAMKNELKSKVSKVTDQGTAEQKIKNINPTHDPNMKTKNQNEDDKDEVEDEDYMSSLYIDESTSSSLSFTSTKKRKQPSSASVPTVEQQPKKLDRSNIGMQVLLKLGYQEGHALGKQQQGRLEPLPIPIRLGRKGIGLSQSKLSHEVEPTTSSSTLPNSQVSTSLQQIHQEKYRAWTNTKFNLKSVLWDIQKCRRMCYQLDQQVQSTSFFFYWPIVHQPSSSSSSSSLEINSEISLTEIEEDTHESDLLPSSLPPESMEFEQLDPLSQLDLLLSYLRSTYSYCLYCGCSFPTSEEMKLECPGVSREEHD
ncbi:G patch domain-containing protein 11 [Coelomomyces lativittatus]|nr:G patch domain-containing protein 11 [Coelomomyces lativittatus]KAJ1512597.1 G patch domain-containing protein 11 [Coelomomyces lativittatus]KAJ1515824.1 G patch domain-containing protein 11 [Coelomomyces lativittatus]